MIYAYTRLRYQVSIYRTIGPLVLMREPCYHMIMYIYSGCYSSFIWQLTSLRNPAMCLAYVITCLL